MLYNSLKSKNTENSIDSFNTNISYISNEKNYIIFITSIIILISGVFCFFLRKNWTRNFYLIPKIFVFLYLGISLCFLLLFGVLDFFNFLLTFFQNENSLAFVETKDQSITLLIFSIVMGSYYGFIYSIVKIEKNNFSLESQMSWNHHFSLPFGIFCGIIWTLVNEVLAMNSGKYKLVGKNEEDPFNEEI